MKEHDSIILGKRVADEISRDSKAIAAKLFAIDFPDQRNMTRADYLVWVKQSWPNIEFRKALRVRVGDKAFLATGKAAMEAQNGMDI